MGHLDTEDRNWAVLAHASGALSTVIIPSVGFLGPLLIWFLRKDQSAEVARHARQAMVFQLAMSVLAWVLGAMGSALVCVGVGFVLLAAAVVPWLAAIIVPIVAAVRVNNGEDDFEYPFVGQLDPGSRPRLQ